ncbi:hypothetical protein B0H14DRAFT_3142799 [Mycena olivaceomarginata]|nr:hypothetical protein B0H14DRAFT_3142799 [Mycena olivaceomarginata]
MRVVHSACQKPQPVTRLQSEATAASKQPRTFPDMIRMVPVHSRTSAFRPPLSCATTIMPTNHDETGRKTVFKINTDKLPYSQNTPEACAYCDRRRDDKEKPLPLCGGCRSVRFCSAEHQKAFWPLHKVFCKQAQKQKQLQAEIGPSGDYFALEKTTAYASLRTGSQSITIPFRAVQGSPAAAGIATILPLVESQNAQEVVWGLFICRYVIDDIQSWISASYIYEDDIPQGPQRPADRPCHWFAEYCSRLGLVFRLVGPRSDSWKPGIMGKKGNKWVWKEHTLEELAALGIRLNHGPITV